MSPRRSLLASVAAGSCLAASVVAGGYAASGAMPFSQWPAALSSSNNSAEVALAAVPRTEAPVLTLATPERETTRVIPLDAAPAPASEQTADTPDRSATRLPKSVSRAPKTDDPEPASKPTTAPATPTAAATPAATAASPAAEQGPTQPAAPVTPPTTRRVKLGDVSTSFASASSSQSGQPELKVQMAVADDTQTAQTRTVSLSLKLASTDIQTLRRNAAVMGSTAIALETEVDVVDNTVVSAGQPACADGTCLRVQMKFAQDTRTNPADQPEVSLLEDGDAISNRVKVVVKIDAADLGTEPSPAPGPSDPAAEPAPEAGTPSVMSLPLPPAADPDPTTPDVPATPATDTTTVTLPGADPVPGNPEPSSVQIKAQLDVVDTPVTPAAPETTQASDTSGATDVAPPQDAGPSQTKGNDNCT
jgi:S-DNA-T family DNA segregation ATPase FtsK/SpoIIIE